jgi:hypothetical protein
MKTKKNKVKKKGGTILPHHTLLINPTWRTGGVPWSTFFKSGLATSQFYGTSLPFCDVGQELQCFQTLAFYMYEHEIRHIISLQSCAISPIDAEANNHGCDPAYLNMEDNLWTTLKSLDNNNRVDPHYRMTNIPIRDMTVGMWENWNAINQLRFTTANEKTLFHCYAGFGRTGSILFMLTLRDHYLYYPALMPANTLTTPYLGNINSRNLWNFLRMLLIFNFRLVSSTNPLIAARINVFNPHEIINEIFNIDTLFLANLFISRINYIFKCCAQAINHPNFCGYPLHVVFPVGGFNVDNIFNVPIMLIS